MPKVSGLVITWAGAYMVTSLIAYRISHLSLRMTHSADWNNYFRRKIEEEKAAGSWDGELMDADGRSSNIQPCAA